MLYLHILWYIANIAFSSLPPTKVIHSKQMITLIRLLQWVLGLWVSPSISIHHAPRVSHCSNLHVVRKHDKLVTDPDPIAGDEPVDPRVVEGGVHPLLSREAPDDGVVVPRGEGGHVAVQVGQSVVSPWHHAKPELVGHVYVHASQRCLK